MLDVGQFFRSMRDRLCLSCFQIVKRDLKLSRSNHLGLDLSINFWNCLFFLEFCLGLLCTFLLFLEILNESRLSLDNIGEVRLLFRSSFSKVIAFERFELLSKLRNFLLKVIYLVLKLCILQLKIAVRIFLQANSCSSHSSSLSFF